MRTPGCPLRTPLISNRIMTNLNTDTAFGSPIRIGEFVYNNTILNPPRPNHFHVEYHKQHILTISTHPSGVDNEVRDTLYSCLAAGHSVKIGHSAAFVCRKCDLMLAANHEYVRVGGNLYVGKDFEDKGVYEISVYPFDYTDFLDAVYLAQKIIPSYS